MDEDDRIMFDSGVKVDFNESRKSYNIVWTFGGFMSFIVRCSPSFWCRDLSGASFSASEIGERSEWDLFICHNPADNYIRCEYTDDLHMSFNLKRTDEGTCPKLVQGRFWLKKLDGTTEVLKNNIRHQFFRKDDSCELFICERSRFQSRRELAPEGCLILVCELKITDDWSFPSRLPYLENMFSLKVGCDATLKVGYEKFPVHKATLASRSTVFQEMFQTNATLEIYDFHPEPFKHFLMYLYSGKISGDVCELYKIAFRYKTEELKRACADYISCNISVDNVTDVFTLSRNYAEVALKNKSQEFFNKHFKDVLRTGKWEKLKRDNRDIADEMFSNIPVPEETPQQSVDQNHCVVN